jgi:hypothetical protein
MLGYKSSTGERYCLDSRADARLYKPCQMATSSSGILVSLIDHFPHEVTDDNNDYSANHRNNMVQRLKSAAQP